jgi:hypothetical protein
MGSTSEDFLNALSASHRVLLLGGLAVIAHGMSRTTKDADVWLDSTLPLEEWIAAIERNLPKARKIYLFDLFRKEEISFAQAPVVVEELGVLRVGGLDRPVDIFRRPNELEIEEFDLAWEVSRPHILNLRLLDATLLIVTKASSERDRDREDIAFLEEKVRREWSAILAVCPLAEATALFSRYLDHATAEAALQNPDPAVRALGLEGLRELAEGGNPFAIAALKRLDSPT